MITCNADTLTLTETWLGASTVAQVLSEIVAQLDKSDRFQFLEGLCMKRIHSTVDNTCTHSEHMNPGKTK